MTEEWCCEKLESLKIKENQLTTLTEIRGRLNETPNLEVKVTNRLLSSPEIYDCLEDESPESVSGGTVRPLDLVSDILSICMTNLTLRQSDLPRLLERALQHKRPRIRALALNTILKELKNQSSDDAAGDALSDDLVGHVLRALQEEETQLGNPAVCILCLVLHGRLDRPYVKESLLRALKQNEVIKCRVYDLGVNMAKRSAATLEKVEYILDHALSELDNEDVLLQVNILEILVSLTEQNHGLLYLERCQVFDVISKKVEQIDENPLDRLLVPGVMKFFGKIAAVQPQKIITGENHLIRCLFDSLRSDDVALLPSAFDTLANLCQTPRGIMLLEEHYGSALKQSLVDFLSYIRNLPTELKCRALSCLEVIFTFDTEVSADVSKTLQRWFGYLTAEQNNMQFLMDLCRNPFPDIKISTLNLVGTICLHPWGVEALKNTAGFLEFLLDRNIEFDKEAKYAKYCVIKLLADSTFFDHETRLRLRTYVNEGPHFSQCRMDIAMEGN